MIGPYPTILNTFGAKNAALIVYHGEYWRLLTPVFLHAGVIHLLVNILIQFRVGVLLELQWGALRFIGNHFGMNLFCPTKHRS